jgi:hypothetical protein
VDEGPDLADPVDIDAWEDELDDMTHGALRKVKSWPVLRQEIKKTLKAQHKSLALSEINQLIILRDFATLLIKGMTRAQASLRIAEQWRDGAGTHFARRVCALARHYQVFEKLPKETRGR